MAVIICHTSASSKTKPSLTSLQQNTFLVCWANRYWVCAAKTTELLCPAQSGLGSFLFTAFSLKYLLQLCWKSTWSGFLELSFGAGPDQVRAGRVSNLCCWTVPKVAMVGSVAQEMKGRWETNCDGFRDRQMTHENITHLEMFLQWDTMTDGEWTKSWLAFSDSAVQFGHSHHMLFQCKSQFVKTKALPHQVSCLKFV